MGVEPWQPRSRASHKGHYGHVCVIGGEVGYSGAARMAAEAAARVGAGLISIGSRAEHAPYLNMGRPELMCHPVESRDALLALAERTSVWAIGPGLGKGAWGAMVFESLLPRMAERAVVLDADGLNWLVERPTLNDHWVMTPHPGEAARLLGTTTAVVQQDRLQAAEALQSRYGGVIVLKGAGTIVASRDATPAICAGGNPGMATGGMGDVLTGIIAGLLAQGIPPRAAAERGVALHAWAADHAAAELGERGLLASDLFVWLRRGVNHCV